MEHSNINQLQIDFGHQKPLLSPMPIKKIHNAKGNNFFRLQDQGIDTAKRFVSNLAEEHFEIEMLHGKQREAKMGEFKTKLLENLLNTSIYKSILPPDYFEEFKDDLLRIHSIK